MKTYTGYVAQETLDHFDEASGMLGQQGNFNMHIMAKRPDVLYSSHPETLVRVRLQVVPPTALETAWDAMPPADQSALAFFGGGPSLNEMRNAVKNMATLNGRLATIVEALAKLAE